MKTLRVMAAALGYGLLERRGLTRMAGLDFSPRPSVFPALTCVAQATLRTGLKPAEHGLIANGVWIEALKKPLFWEQSAELVHGARCWCERDGVFFFQQSLGEKVALIISPAPIHRHGGGMIMSAYTRPTELAAELRRRCGRFPLGRYWGPLASAKVGRKVIDYFETALEVRDVDTAYLYLPTLDYAAQKYGPDSPAAQAALREFQSQLERLAVLCGRRGAALEVLGDYEIAAVTGDGLMPNATLRRAGLFRVRTVAGMAYPDFYQSSAFALCDHEVAILVGERRQAAAEILLATGDYEDASERVGGGERVLLARRGSWCDYRWWTDRREAPDYAGHVDIHNKPGFDPRELYFGCRGSVRGTHGRQTQVAYGT